MKSNKLCNCPMSWSSSWLNWKWPRHQSLPYVHFNIYTLPCLPVRCACIFEYGEDRSDADLSSTGKVWRLTAANTAQWILWSFPSQHMNQPAIERRWGRIDEYTSHSAQKISFQEMQTYLLVCVQSNWCLRHETVGQQSRESKQQAEEVQTHQSDDLFRTEIWWS